MSLAAATAGERELKVPAVSLLPPDDEAAADLGSKEPGGVKRRSRPGRKLNGVLRGDTRSLYISPGESWRAVWPNVSQLYSVHSCKQLAYCNLLDVLNRPNTFDCVFS